MLLRGVRVVRVGGERLADERVVQLAGVVRLQELYALFRLAERDVDACHSAVERRLADVRILVLRDEAAGAAIELQRAPQQPGVPRADAAHVVVLRGVIGDLKAVRPAAERSLRLLQRAVLAVVDAGLEPGHGLRLPAAELKARQRVYGHIEELRHVRDEAQLRRRRAALPLGDRRKAHAQRLRQPLLRHPGRTPQRAYVLRK